jgi:hypothetical protein
MPARGNWRSLEIQRQLLPFDGLPVEAGLPAPKRINSLLERRWQLRAGIGPAASARYRLLGL